jgi:hypothetical protein
MTKDQEKEVRLLVLNVQAVYTDEQIRELCARLLDIDPGTLRAWLARMEAKQS